MSDSDVLTKTTASSGCCWFPLSENKKTASKIILLVVSLLGIGAAVTLGGWGQTLLPELSKTPMTHIGVTAICGGVGVGGLISFAVWSIVDYARARASSKRLVTEEDPILDPKPLEPAAEKKWQLDMRDFGEFIPENFCYRELKNKIVLMGYGPDFSTRLSNENLGDEIDKPPTDVEMHKTLLQENSGAMLFFLKGDWLTVRNLEPLGNIKEGETLTLVMTEVSTLNVFSLKNKQTIHIRRNEEEDWITLSLKE